MEETREELPNFSIGIDLLGPDPTSNKNKAEKNSQVARFANLSEDQLQQILAERQTFTGNKKNHQFLPHIMEGSVYKTQLHYIAYFISIPNTKQQRTLY